MNSITHELRLACRALLQHRSFTVLVLLALGIGIGAMTAVFSIVNVVLLRPLPVQEPDRLVAVASGRPGMMGSNVTRTQYEEVKERNQDFEGVSAYQKRMATWQEGSRNRQIMIETVAGNYFSLLGVPVAFGRGLTEADDTPGADPVVVISHHFWNHHLKSEPGILGKTLQIEGKSFAVVGVVADAYSGIMPLVPTDFWLSNVSDELSAEAGRDPKQIENSWREFSIIGRLNPGVSRVAAENNLRGIFAQLRSDADKADQSKERIRLLSAGRGTLPPHLQKGGWKVALSFLGMTSLVLLVACANVANLLLARAVARRKEIAVRLAIGASRCQLVRQLLMESLVLALLAGGFGFAIAGWAGNALLSWEPLTHLAPLRLALELPMDFRVFGFALAVAAVTSVLFGLAPALQATRTSILPALTDEASIQPGRARLLGLRNLLLVAQVTFSVVLLIAAVMPLRGWWKQQRQIAEEGYHNLLLAPLTLADSLLYRSLEDRRRFLREAEETLKALPGIEKVAFTTIPPLAEGRSGMFGATVIDPDKGETTIPHVAVGTVSAGYFDAVDAPLLQGRQFAAFDTEQSVKVAIINEAFARKHLPDRNPLGHRIRIQEQVLEICGVVRTDWVRPGSDEALPAVFRPLSQHRADGQIFLLARTLGNAAAYRQTVSSIILQLDPNALNFGGVRTAQEHREQEQWPTLVMARLMGACSLLALALAAVGIYGVVNYNVTRRTREIGIRMALGARRGSILALVLRQVTILVLLGIALGLILVWGIGQLAAAMITIGRIANPLGNSGIVVVLAVVAIVSSLIPAFRATKVNPVEALRHE